MQVAGLMAFFVLPLMLTPLAGAESAKLSCADILSAYLEGSESVEYGQVIESSLEQVKDLQAGVTVPLTHLNDLSLLIKRGAIYDSIHQVLAVQGARSKDEMRDALIILRNFSNKRQKRDFVNSVIENLYKKFPSQIDPYENSNYDKLLKKQSASASMTIDEYNQVTRALKEDKRNNDPTLHLLILESLTGENSRLLTDVQNHLTWWKKRQLPEKSSTRTWKVSEELFFLQSLTEKIDRFEKGQLTASEYELEFAKLFKSIFERMNYMSLSQVTRGKVNILKGSFLTVARPEFYTAAIDRMQKGLEQNADQLEVEQALAIAVERFAKHYGDPRFDSVREEVLGWYKGHKLRQKYLKDSFSVCRDGL